MLRLLSLMCLAGSCNLLPLQHDIESGMQWDGGSGQDKVSLGERLRRELRFGAQGVVSWNQTFGKAVQCCFYKEGSDTFHSAGESGYLYELDGEGKQIRGDPPLGMRSSVPLGGLGTGSTELRADGTFADWLVENGGPGLSLNGKIPIKEEMLLAIKVGNLTASVRTHPPRGIPGVESLAYSGSFPVSRLSVKDARLEGGDATIYSYSPMKIYDEDASGIPCIVFSLVISNPSTGQPLDAKLSLILPLSHEMDQARGLITSGFTLAGQEGEGGSSARLRIDARFDGLHEPGGQQGSMVCTVAVVQGRYAGWTALAHMEEGVGGTMSISWKHDESSRPNSDQLPPPPPGTNVTIGCGGAGMISLRESSIGCMQACRAEAWCASWTWEGGVCFSMRAVGVERRRLSAWSGVIGDWRSESDAELSLLRPGMSHASGDFTVRGYTDGKGHAQGADGGSKMRKGDGFEDGGATFLTTGDTLHDVWAWFSEEGGAYERGKVEPGGGYGGYAVSMSVPPGEERVLSLVFAWRLPHRVHAGEDIGNRYASAFESSRQVAEYSVERRRGILDGVVEWHR